MPKTDDGVAIERIRIVCTFVIWFCPCCKRGRESLRITERSEVYCHLTAKGQLVGTITDLLFIAIHVNGILYGILYLCGLLCLHPFYGRPM